MTEIWWALLAAVLGTYLLKHAGQSVPQTVLERPIVRAVAEGLPVALLCALVAVQTFTAGQTLTLDARAAGLAAAVVALLLRAPFLVVVIVGAAVAAGFRALGWAV